MDFNDYQNKAHETAQYPEDQALIYTTLGLVGEAGEIANKVKKVIRDDGGKLTYERMLDLYGEIGDVLWYAAELCTALSIDMADVAQANLNKLRSRQQRGVIQGDGDQR